MKKWMLASRCGECKEPTPFDVCSFLGYNPGVSGHLFKSKEEAEEALEATRRDIVKHGYEINAETVNGHYLLEGPLMENGNFWQYSSSIMDLANERPCIIPQKRGFRVHDVTVIDNVFAVEVEFFL